MQELMQNIKHQILENTLGYSLYLIYFKKNKDDASKV